MSGVRLKTQALHSFSVAPNRALLRVHSRLSFETDAHRLSFTLSGLSLFEKFRSAVRNNHGGTSSASPHFQNS